MSSYALDTSEGRAAARMIHEHAISLLNADRQVEVDELEELKRQNYSNMSKREVLRGKVYNRKTRGRICLWVGAIILIIGLLNIPNPDHKSVAIPMAIGGIALVVLGIILFITCAKYSPELEELNAVLCNFDRAASGLQSKIDEFDEKISEHRSALAEIADRENHTVFYKWADSAATNHVLLYVTGEVHPLENKPLPPKAKRYGSCHVSDARIYIDEMVYANVNLKELRAMAIACIDDPGTHKLQIYAEYNIGGRLTYEWNSAPVPIKPSNSSVFVWLHVSTSGKGTQCFCSSYSTVHEFMSATGISKDEMVAKFL